MNPNIQPEMDNINQIRDAVFGLVGSAAGALSYLIVNRAITPDEATQRLHALENMIRAAENLGFD